MPRSAAKKAAPFCLQRAAAFSILGVPRFEAMAFAEKLRALRGQAGLSQEKLAEKLGGVPAEPFDTSGAGTGLATPFFPYRPDFD